MCITTFLLSINVNYLDYIFFAQILTLENIIPLKPIDCSDSNGV